MQRIVNAKIYVIKDLFGILVIVSVNVINHVMLVSILDYGNCRCRKKLVDKLVEECTKTDEMKLAKIALAEHESWSGYSSCKLCIVLLSTLLQLTLELVLILFITNT